MAEEFINQGGVCSGNWWNPSKNTLFSGATGDMACCGWQVESNCGVLIPSTNSGWTQALLFGGVASNGLSTSNPSNFSPNNIMHETGSSDDSSHIHNDWSPGLAGTFAGKPVEDHEDSSPISAFKHQVHFPAQASENYASGYPLNMIKSFLLDQPPPSLFDKNRSTHPAVDYSSQFVPSYGPSSSSDSSMTTSFGKFSSLLKPINTTLPNPPQPSRLHLSNNKPYWNASMSALDDIRASLLESPQSTISSSLLHEKQNRSNLITKATSQYSQVSGSVEKKVSPEPAFKRARIETPSPLPTFKVRKEKLGDRITSLQQLVSPFGKTDTASVLQEAIECIKFLHDQVNALSSPYMKNGDPFQNHQKVSTERALKDEEGPNVDLKSRGICLVPVSITFPMTSENPADFWTPTFADPSDDKYVHVYPRKSDGYDI